MRTLKRISGPTWGMTLHDMRNLYLTKIRPIITYTCRAWFLYSDNRNWAWDITEKLLKKLEQLQYRNLLQISGVMKKTCYDVILKSFILIDLSSRCTEYQSLSAHALSMTRIHWKCRRSG